MGHPRDLSSPDNGQLNLHTVGLQHGHVDRVDIAEPELGPGLAPVGNVPRVLTLHLWFLALEHPIRHMASGSRLLVLLGALPLMVGCLKTGATNAPPGVSLSSPEIGSLFGLGVAIVAGYVQRKIRLPAFRICRLLYDHIAIARDVAGAPAEGQPVAIAPPNERDESIVMTVGDDLPTARRFYGSFHGV